ncbi:hypothetical protein EDD69_11322 [Thermolongibacillus altinsuensis]|uniref:Uncharacterized protein n=1 Tax=Thermolongibacillus altinsuensis TaxID=575256 RepID=A0A4V2QA11_9BACL|nr:hypothetical protein EDD69_11322 [Thermolongibacillus altinsuensis]
MKYKIRRINNFFLITIIMLLTISPFSEVHSEKRQKIYIKVDLWTKELYVIEGGKVIRRYKISPSKSEPFTNNGRSNEKGVYIIRYIRII